MVGMVHTTAPRQLSRSEADTIDAQAVRIARAALSGELDEAEVRWRLAALVQQAGISAVEAERCGARWPALHPSDIEHQLDNVIQSKLTGAEGRPPSYDIQTLAGGASLVGWARKLTQSASHKIASRLRDGSSRSRPIEPDELARLMVEPTLGRSYTDHTTTGAACSVTEDDVEVFRRQIRSMRTNGQVHHRTEALLRLYGLPAPARQSLSARRERIASVLNGDAEAARRSLATAIQPIGTADVAACWNGWPPEAKQHLARLDARVAHQLALASITPIPPVQQKVVAQVRNRVAAQIGDLEMARSLVACWVTARSETTGNEFAGRGAPSRVKSVSQHEADRAAWDQIVTEASKSGAIDALGSGPQGVWNALEKLRRTVERELAQG